MVVTHKQPQAKVLHKFVWHKPAWRDGDLRWLGGLICAASALLVVLLLVALV